MKPSAPPPRKKRNVTKRIDDTAAAELSADEVAIVFSFLRPKDIMLARVCTTWRDAGIKTIVPLCDFAVKDAKSYNAMLAMSTALPNLQQLTLSDLRNEKYTDGDDPNVAIARYTAYEHVHDIYFISNFSKLRILKLQHTPLNGRYPALFNFPLLEQLAISYCDTLKWDLEMLSGLPLLKDLYSNSDYPTGNISSLRVLKNTLEKVTIASSIDYLRGDFLDLADFPHLTVLNLQGTDVTGDIRDISGDDFPAIERLLLPQSVVGGIGYEFQRISDVPVFMQAIHHLLQRNLTIFECIGIGDSDCYSSICFWSLSWSSPDWYSRDEDGKPAPPFSLDFIQAGSRLGWRWYGLTEESDYTCCEANWLDPEPSSDDETYDREVFDVERPVDFYKGYHQPPTEEEYVRLCEDE